MPRRPKNRAALRGYEYRNPPSGPADPGILIQGLGTFTLDYVWLARVDVAQHPVEVAELQIPLTAHYYALTLHPPQGWPDLRLDVVGTLARPVDSPEAPVWIDRLWSAIPRPILAWRRRVWCRGSPLYLEALWSPTAERPTIDIRGVEQDTRLTHLQAVQDALSLLTGVRGVGRRRGSWYWTREDFHAAWPAKIAEAQRRRDGPVRLEDLARVYGVSYSTLLRYLRTYGRPQR